MESIQTRRFCYFPLGKKRRGFFVPFACSVSFYLFGGGRKVVNNLIVSTSLSFFSSFLISHFSGRQKIVVVEYASEQRRHKGKSFSLIGTKYGNRKIRVDFWKSNRPRVGQWPHWNLGNWRGRKKKQPSHQTIQTRKWIRESKDSTILQLSYHILLFICWRVR